MTIALSNYYESEVFPQNGIGIDARYIWKQRRHIREKQEDSASSITGSLKDTILEIYDECKNSGWDGYNADPISERVVHEAIRFVELFPLNISIPEILPVPNGDIDFTWRRAKSYVLSLAINHQGILSFAYIFGKDEAFGHFNIYNEIPELIVTLIQRVHNV